MNVKHQGNLNLNLGSIKVGGKTLSLESLFEVDEVDIDTEYREQSALYAYFIVQEAYAERDHSEVVAEKDLVHAELDEHYRRLLKANDSKTTENAIESSIIQDAAYGKILMDVIRAKQHWSILKGITKALEQRASMLVSMGAHRRAEFNMTNMTVRTETLQEFSDTIDEMKTNLKNKRQNADTPV